MRSALKLLYIYRLYIIILLYILKLHQSVPWTVPKLDADGNVMKDVNGKDLWTGYCVDFVQKLSEEMDFDYDLVVPADRQFGKKLPNGQWDGLIGDLAKGVGNDA